MLTAVLGVTFLVGVVGFEWSGHIQPSHGAYGAVLYGMTGMHALHVLSGVVFILLVWNRGRKGGFSAERHWGVEACAIYWHYVDVVWVFFYPALIDALVGENPVTWFTRCIALLGLALDVSAVVPHGGLARAAAHPPPGTAAATRHRPAAGVLPGRPVALAIAPMSPVDVLSGQLLLMHMIQHKLLIVFAPPLLWAANPLPFFLWGLPPRLRRQSARLLSPASPFRRTLRALTSPGLVWLAFVSILVGWHDPNAYNAALRSDLVHDIEHLTFFGSAMLFCACRRGPRSLTVARCAWLTCWAWCRSTWP
jgi:hypothetical protein